MYPYFQHIPLGKSIPLNNPHAVSVSLPTMKDVIGYEENDNAVKSRMQSGYPRFFVNKLVEKLADFLRRKHCDLLKITAFNKDGGQIAMK